MKSKSIVLYLALFLISFNIVAQGIQIPKSSDIEERGGKQYFVHTVQKGQTVYSIAKAYNVSVDEIYFENPGSKSGVRIGQQLWIPTVNKETEVNKEVSTASFDFFYHIVNENENFTNISELYNIPERYIRLANPGIVEPIKYGEYIKVPVESSFAILDGKKTRHYKEPDISYIPPPAAKRQQAPVTPKHQPSKGVSFNPNVKVMTDYRHVVINGENLERIAKKYQITVEDLKMVNPGLNRVMQGDRLRLPDYAKVPGVKQDIPSGDYDIKVQGKPREQQPTKESLYYKYTVQRGDNLYKVSRKFGVSLEAMHKANPSLNGTTLFEGQAILIPKLKKRPRFIYYETPAKTKLKKIARLFGISNKQIKASNPGLKNKVFAGQVVKIPGGEQAVLLAAPPEISKAKEEVLVEKHKTSRCQPSPYRGKVFKVALMIPLFLEEMDNINYDDFQATFQPGYKPFRFVEFLEGALIAIDSLKQQGYNLEFYFYDVDNQITKTTKVLQRKELKSMDLIIGPFYSKSFNQVALYAENFNIPVINPFTFREEIMGKYENIIKVKPSILSQIPLLTKLIKNRYADHKVFLVSQNSYKDADIVAQLSTALAESVPASVRLSNVDINNVSVEVDNRLVEEDELASPYYNLEGKPIDPAVIDANLYDSTVFNNKPITINYMSDSVHPVLDNASVIRKNLVILFGNNKSYLMDAINQLNRVRDTFDIEIIGIPLWENIKNMDYMMLNNLNLTYFTSYHINYNEERTQQFVAKFRSNFETEPNSYGFSGFDITLFFVKALADYNKHFKRCLPEISSRALENGFRFERTGHKENNFENVMWNIIRIKDYKTIRLPESDLITIDKK